MTGLATVALSVDDTVHTVRGLPKLLHDHADVLIARPIKVVVIIVVALALRLIAHRFIDRLTKATAEGVVPPLLRPLKEHAAGVFEVSPLQHERRRQRAETVGSVLKSATSVTLFVLALLLVLGEIGIPLAPLVAGTSIVGVALGFGAQNIVKDFLGGMFMILEDQYGVGDLVDTGVGGASGTVEAVGLRTTRLRDLRGTVWYVRNGEIIRVGNKSQGYAQALVDVPLLATADLPAATETVRSVAGDMATESEWMGRMLGVPELLGVESVTREQTTLRLIARVKPMEQFAVQRELLRRIREALGPDDIGPTPAAPPMHESTEPPAGE